MFDAKLLFLGAVQGLTEFLPVSSSGHLAFFQLLFGYVDTNMLSYDIALHLSTLFATLCFFWRDIVQISSEWFGGFVRPKLRRRDGWRYGWTVICGTIVTVVIALPLKKVVEYAMTSPIIVAIGLLFTSFVLWLMGSMYTSSRRVSLKTGLIVGAAQGIAAMPGVSRSGFTIFAGLLSGLVPEEAFKFSFILSIPAILGATLLEVLDMFRAGEISLPNGWVWGCFAAFSLGLASLALLRRFVLGGHWRIFSVYCAFIASLMLALRFLG